MSMELRNVERMPNLLFIGKIAFCKVLGNNDVRNMIYKNPHSPWNSLNAGFLEYFSGLSANEINCIAQSDNLTKGPRFYKNNNALWKQLVCTTINGEQRKHIYKWSVNKHLNWIVTFSWMVNFSEHLTMHYLWISLAYSLFSHRLKAPKILTEKLWKSSPMRIRGMLLFALLWVIRRPPETYYRTE